ncbi:MAG: bifunctional aspartate kinase/homoserine dehydrogenase I [Bacteroidetes bacterium]|nr:bifunctional aspartate kinase/homoserine dehydrogenase I [Bacteroidota bacterium]
MYVLKFGGSSVANAERIKGVAEIVVSAKKKHKQVAVVISALGGVTDELIALTNGALQGEENIKETFKKVETRHYEAVKALVPVQRQTQVLGNVVHTLNQLYDILKGISLIREVSPKTHDLVISFGERLSAYIVSEGLKEYVKDAAFADARQFIKTNGDFGNAKVNFTKTNKLIREYFANTKGTHVVTGFIASTDNGDTTTLGRSGSDYTASIVGAALKAEAIEIWTDVDGILTADPRKVAQAFPLKQVTYEEAMELSHFGAKVIFPATMQPAMALKIPIWVKNTFKPDYEGTIISHKASADDHPVKGISSLSSISLLNVQGSGMVGVAGVAGRLFAALSAAKVNIILISQASSEHSICIAVSSSDANRAKNVIDEEFAYEIKSSLVNETAIQSGLSIIAIVGDNMRHLPGTASKMFAGLGKNGINIIAIAQGSSERNISAVIEEKDQAKALNALHEVFFLSDNKVLNVFLLGPGLVGGNLLSIIEKQHDKLRAKHMIDVRVVGIANSKQMLISESGKAYKTWGNANANVKASTIETFVEAIKKLNLPNSIFVDATASDAPVPYYEPLLQAGVAIVTPNKRACSGKYGYYEKLKNLSLRHNARLLYETNVGAGLPVINTLTDLLMSGDDILKIEAVMSGTLNYLFHNFNEEMSFTELLKQAKDLGYTEPDPRDDLSGMDVARKILILARECGYEGELKDVTVENLVPAAARKSKTVDAFFKDLKKFDAEFTKKVKAANAKGKKLKYVAVFEKGKATTGLREVGPEHPFYSLAGTENCFCFTTERYNANPLVVKGPGAGAAVTAAGVFADIIKLSNR